LAAARYNVDGITAPYGKSTSDTRNATRNDSPNDLRKDDPPKDDPGNLRKCT
jgi:hypothetical protein